MIRLYSTNTERDKEVQRVKEKIMLAVEGENTTVVDNAFGELRNFLPNYSTISYISYKKENPAE